MGEITDALRRARHGTAPGAATAARDEPRARREEARETPPEPAAVAEIPRTTEAAWIGRAVLVPAQQAVAECYRQFALQLRPLIEGRSNRAVLVTSALRLEGKTTTACNLALALASLSAERRIALVDLDLRRPSIARGLGIRPGVGIERVLAGEAPLASARVRTDVPALDVFPVEKPRPRAHELFSSQRFPKILEEIRQGYETVVIDGPPVLLVPDPLLIAPFVGGCVAVARSGLTLRSAFRDMLGRLPRDLLLGCFLNDARLPRHARRYSYYYSADGHAEPQD